MSAQFLIAEFLSALTEKRFIDAKNILENSNRVKYIHHFLNFSDDNNDTLMHKTIHAFLEEINKIWKDADSLGPPSCRMIEAELLREIRKKAINRLTEDCISLIDKIIEHKFICDGRNKQDKTPFDLFIDILEEKPKLRKVIAVAQAKITEKLEQGSGRLFSGRRYVTDFQLTRLSKNPNKNCDIFDASPEHDNNGEMKLTLHERQALHGGLLKRQLLGIRLKTPAPNLVIANIGFIISNIPKSNIPENELIRKPIFETFSIIDDQLSIFHKIVGVKDTDTHAESGLCTYLCNHENLNKIIKKLKEKYNGPSHKIYGIVLDIHSGLVVCPGCCSELQTLQIENSSENNFIKILKEILTNAEFLLPKKPPFHVVIRASGIKSSSGDRPKKDLYPSTIIHEDYNRDIKRHDPQVILHLVPKKIPFSDERIYDSEDDQLEKKIAEITEARQKLAEKKLANLSKADTIAHYRFFYNATAFSSTRGSDYHRNFKQLEHKLENIKEETKQEIFEYSLKMYSLKM